MDAPGGSTSKGEPLDTPGGSASKGEPLKTLGGSASKGEPLETPGGSASKGEPLETPRGVGGWGVYTEWTVVISASAVPHSGGNRQTDTAETSGQPAWSAVPSPE